MSLLGQIRIKTDYSLLNSLIKINSLIDFLVKNNITYAGIVDNNLSGSIEFYNKCIQNNIKPIIGLELEYNDQKLFLYAKNYEGYKNLLKLHTYKDNIDKELLIKYSNNIILVLELNNNLDELNFYDDIYIGYTNDKEKIKASLISDKILYFKEIRSLNKEDVKYLKYLNMMGGESKIEYDYSYNTISLEDKITIDEFVKQIDIKIPFNNRYIPVYKEGTDSYKFLCALSKKGLEKRLGSINEVYKKRLEYELSIIKKMDFVDYFLIVYDYCLYAKKNGCLVGPGRGSAAGSLVCYSIGITDIDPIKYNLMFERFLNPDRITMPDIDIDFENTKRDLVIDYVKQKYGYEQVASGLTFNTLKAKLVLREVCKLENINDDLIDKFVKVIDAKLTLKDNLNNDKVKKYLNLYPELKKVYDISLKLEGLKKNISTHAAGIVISSVKLDEVIPIIYEQDNILTGITMEYLENLGLLKMDFLGLKNLTIIANILDKIGNNVLKDINLEDKNVLKLFADAKTNGIFQFETYAMKSLLTKLKPNSFADLVASVALVRPGPSKDDYIKNKESKNNIKYLHSSLKPILEETNGIILYQEQIISILENLGGFTKSEADIIRRAISKKKEDIILESKNKFIKGASKKGIDENTSLKIYELIVKFAGYGFNKSHSVAYALIGYQMAYLKYYYPMYFIGELLKDNKDQNQINSYLTELKNQGIKIVKPEVNYSKEEFWVKDKSLVLPLSLIKGITKEVSDSILKHQPYKDYFDFVLKNKDVLNDKILTILIKAGSLRGFKLNIKTMINNIDEILNYASLGLDDDNLKPIITEYEEYSDEELSKDEFNSFGFYVGNHPSSKYNDKDILKIDNINNALFKNVKMVVLIEKISKIKTKNNDDMAFISVSDETGKCEAVLFKDAFDSLEKIDKNDLVLIHGKVSKSFDKIRIIINNINKTNI